VIDTHAHLDACADPPEAVLERARAAGVGRVVSVGTSVESCRWTVALCQRATGVSAALGIHPHEAGKVGGEEVAELRELFGHVEAVAVGETGLDFYRDYAPREAQQRLFGEHLELAAELDLPVVVHTRAAAAETLERLATFRGDVVLHCFSDPALLGAAVDRGYYVSFAGNVTYPKAEDLRAAAARIPADRILAETDSPYLSPQPVRGGTNEPAHVVHTVGALAAARGEAADDLEAQIDANARRVFSLP
jgi:TatD DNase family protein